MQSRRDAKLIKLISHTESVKRLKRFLIYAWSPFANLLWYLYTVILGAISLALWPFDRSGAMQHRCARLWSRLIARTIFARVITRGAENIRPDCSYIYMANHTSLIDIPALFGYLPYEFRIMAKKELFHVPFLGWHLWAAGHFKVDRGNARKTARSLRRVVEGLGAGKSLAVFPEGARSGDGRLLPFKAGAFKIAMRTGLPIVPVALRGAHRLLPKGSLAPRPGTVEVIIGEPIDTKQYRQEHLPELMARTREAIQSNL